MAQPIAILQGQPGATAGRFCLSLADASARGAGRADARCKISVW
ncbi:hypothetical protein [Methylocystis echinoides]|nr:hypothetical protein [Methylocystis echinoides]